MVRIRGTQARGDEADWTRALVREAQVRSALHGYETVVRFLRETPWPPGPEAKAILDLFYGQTLVHYLQAYSWEIRQRERVESKDPLDLKKWTTDEIGAEATRAYSRVWAQREKSRRRSHRPHRRLPAARELPSTHPGNGAGRRLLPDRRAARGHGALEPRAARAVPARRGGAACAHPGEPRRSRRAPAHEARRRPHGPGGLAHRGRPQGGGLRGAPGAAPAAARLVHRERGPNADSPRPGEPASRDARPRMVGRGPGDARGLRQGRGRRRRPRRARAPSPWPEPPPTRSRSADASAAPSSPRSRPRPISSPP